jgi:hypothetical protein
MPPPAACRMSEKRSQDMKSMVYVFGAKREMWAGEGEYRLMMRERQR